MSDNLNTSEAPEGEVAFTPAQLWTIVVDERRRVTFGEERDGMCVFLESPEVVVMVSTEGRRRKLPVSIGPRKLAIAWEAFKEFPLHNSQDPHDSDDPAPM